MPSGPFDAPVPAWLQERALIETRASLAAAQGMGGLLGTMVAGGARSLSEQDTSFLQGMDEAKMAQQDPMWALKKKQVEANIQNARTLTTAKWLDYDRKMDQARWQEESLMALQGYDGSTPVPEGIKDIRVLQQANRMRQDYVTGQLKTQKLENDAAIAKARLDLQSESLGLKQQQIDLSGQKLQQQQEQFDKKIAAQTALEAQKQQGRIDLEKLKSLDRKDAQGRPLTKLQFINRHLNTVYKDLVTNNPDPKKQITVQDASKVLSDAFDALPHEQPTNAPSQDPLGILK